MTLILSIETQRETEIVEMMFLILPIISLKTTSAAWAGISVTATLKVILIYQTVYLTIGSVRMRVYTRPLYG